ncbi:IclR family transcriptional regulator [Amorphus sp. MBR-141]
MAEDNPKKSGVIQSVALALQVLETLAEAGGDMGVTVLAAELKTTKSRIHRHLRTLLTLDYIAQSRQTERYRIGPRLIALGHAASSSADLVSVAAPHLRTLRDLTGQAVSLGLISADGIRILHTLSGTMQIEVGVRAGSLLGFHNSAQGKVALAAMPEDLRQALIPDPILPATDYTITDRDDFLAQINTIAECGWATAPNETVLGLNALASLVLNAEGEAIATVALVSLTQYIETPPSPVQIQAVRNAAAGISHDLGHTG